MWNWRAVYSWAFLIAVFYNKISEAKWFRHLKITFPSFETGIWDWGSSVVGCLLMRRRGGVCPCVHNGEWLLGNPLMRTPLWPEAPVYDSHYSHRHTVSGLCKATSVHNHSSVKSCPEGAGQMGQQIRTLAAPQRTLAQFPLPLTGGSHPFVPPASGNLTFPAS